MGLCNRGHQLLSLHKLVVLVPRLAELLPAGVLMGTVLQPHEAHIPFVLQFMIDYNLYGMNLVHFSSIRFRSGGRGK